MPVRRPRWRAYLLLARVSNLPTVWSNVLAGTVVSAGTADVPVERMLVTALAASLFYTGGMFLNDAMDAGIDARQRPERPIPSGDVSRSEAVGVGAACLLGGEMLLLPRPAAVGLGALLAAAIVLYDWRHKGISWAPLVMGSCRGLVYVVAGASIGALRGATLGAGSLVGIYVAGLSVVARRAGANARWLVPALIAGISLLDALLIGVVSGAWGMAALAALGFPLTLALQRFVPGD
jgi:4-hydroxybenzoate polyprenyltransferase